MASRVASEYLWTKQKGHLNFNTSLKYRATVFHPITLRLSQSLALPYLIGSAMRSPKPASSDGILPRPANSTMKCSLQKKWKRLSTSMKQKHTLSNCRQCALDHLSLQESFPKGPVYYTDPIVSFPPNSTSERKVVRLAKVQKKSDHRKMNHQMRDCVSQQLSDSAPLTVLAENESFCSYQRKRLSQSFEKLPPKKRARYETLSQENVDWDADGALTYLTRLKWRPTRIPSRPTRPITPTPLKWRPTRIPSRPTRPITPTPLKWRPTRIPSRPTRPITSTRLRATWPRGKHSGCCC